MPRRPWLSLSGSAGQLLGLSPWSRRTGRFFTPLSLVGRRFFSPLSTLLCLSFTGGPAFVGWSLTGCFGTGATLVTVTPLAPAGGCAGTGAVWVTFCAGAPGAGWPPNQVD